MSDTTPRRVFYVAVDRTWLDGDGALLTDPDGRPCAATREALELARRNGVEPVPMSGHGQARLAPAMQELGLSSYICEGGVHARFDGRDHWLGRLQPQDGMSILAQIEASGLPQQLLGHFAGMLEPYPALQEGREASYAFRGAVDLEEARRLFRRKEPHLTFVEDGVLREHDSTIQAPALRVYYLLPGFGAKAWAVREHRRQCAISYADTAAVGSSWLDLELVREVARYWQLADGLEADPELERFAHLQRDVWPMNVSGGAGVLAALEQTLEHWRMFG